MKNSKDIFVIQIKPASGYLERCGSGFMVLDFYLIKVILRVQSDLKDMVTIEKLINGINRMCIL